CIIPLLCLHSSNVKANFFKKWRISKDFDNQIKNSKAMGRLQGRSFYQQRAFPFSYIPSDWQTKAIEHIHKHNIQANDGAQQLSSIGPSPITVDSQEGPWSGRVTAIAVDPKDPATVYLSSPNGGVWRSTDNGKNWRSLTDNELTQAVGAIAV